MVLVVGCEPRGIVDADYQLELHPRLLHSDVFDQERDVTLSIREGSGQHELSPLGSSSEGSLTLGELGPLDGAWLGLLVEEEGGAGVVAWREVGPFDLGLGDAPLSVDVLLGRPGKMADLDALANPQRTFSTAAAMTAGGDVYLFGGVQNLVFTGANLPGTARILKLDDLDNGSWSFIEVGQMPELGGEARRAAASADLVEGAEGEPLIFVAGGRSLLFASDGSTGTNLRSGFLYDPALDEVVWEGDEALTTRRSEHTTAVLQNGKVILVGGITANGTIRDNPAIELFDPQSRTSTNGVGVVAAGGLGAQVAAIGERGALICGGGALNSDTNGVFLVPSKMCSLVSLSGQVSAAADLPEPLTLFSLTALDDGRVLAAGGVSGPTWSDPSMGACTAPEASPCHTRASLGSAWLYDPEEDSWAPTGPLAHPRSMHEAARLSDGTVLLVGGTVEGGGLFPTVGAPVDCQERFDPQTGTFSETICTATGSGAQPALTSHPQDGVFALSGYDADYAGGRAFGFALAPPPSGLVE